MKVPWNTLKKLNEGWDAIRKNHYQGMHCYLSVIAAFEPGAGSALMEYAEKQFGDTPLHLDNSMPEHNTAFYQKFGFLETSTVDIEDHQVMLRLKK